MTRTEWVASPTGRATFLFLDPCAVILGLVTFVRSRSAVPGVPEGQGPREVVRAPLSRVWRQGDQFVVALRPRDESEVFAVTVIRKGEQWA